MTHFRGINPAGNGWSVSQERVTALNRSAGGGSLHRDLSSFRKTYHMDMPSMCPLTDQFCHTTSGIRDGKRPDRGAQSMFGHIGDQAMIGVLQGFDLRAPYPATN